MSSEVDIANRALTKIGAEPITSFDDGTKRSNLCRDYYPSTRDAVLRAYPWNCAIERQELALDGTAPVFGYAYKYQLPVDPYCLRVLEVENDPEFRIEGRYLHTDEGTVKIKYISRITNPGLFDSLLKEAIEARLSSELSIPVGSGGGADALKIWSLYEAKLREARTMDGMEGNVPDDDSSNVLIDVR